MRKITKKNKYYKNLWRIGIARQIEFTIKAKNRDEAESKALKLLLNLRNKKGQWIGKGIIK